MWALTQASLVIIVHIYLEFDGSYVKPIVVEFHKINKPHKIQNITGYVTRITVLSVRIFCVLLLFVFVFVFGLHNMEAHDSKNMK